MRRSGGEFGAVCLKARADVGKPDDGLAQGSSALRGMRAPCYSVVGSKESRAVEEASLLLLRWRKRRAAEGAQLLLPMSTGA